MTIAALEFLLNRSSRPLLEAPAPSSAQLEQMLLAAARVPDHGALKPYRFIVCEGEALTRLGALYVEALQEGGESDAAVLERTRGLPLRAPMVIVAVAALREHPKAPVQEQLLTAGLATGALINAAEAQGLGAYWRTGPLAYHAGVARRLGLAESEKVIGFVYAGTPKVTEKKPEKQTPAVPASYSRL